MKKTFYLWIMLIPFLIVAGYAQNYSSSSVTFAEMGGDLVIPDSPSLRLDGNLTIEFRINPLILHSTGEYSLISKESTPGTGYAVHVSDRKMHLLTNGISRIKMRDPLPIVGEIHCAFTLSQSDGARVYINGVLDTAVNLPAMSLPLVNSDTLYINKSREYLAFDDIRIWNRALSSEEIRQNFRTPITASTGIYSGLVLSLPFESVATKKFSMLDYSGNNNNGTARGEALINEDRAVPQMRSYNEALELDSINSFLTTNDQMFTSPLTAITLEAWVFPRSFHEDATIFEKGTLPQFRLSLSTEGELVSSINGVTVKSGSFILPNRWTHVAFRFDATTGGYVFLVNTNKVTSGSLSVSVIPSDTSTLYIGCTQGNTSFFDGFIDELRVWNIMLNDEDIAALSVQPLDLTNIPAPASCRSYSFDGSAYSSTDSLSSALIFHGNARFSASATMLGIPVSPMLKAFQGYPRGYYISRSNKRIPEEGTNGAMNPDTISIPEHATINSLNILVALNHSNEQQLQLTLMGPEGDSVRLVNTGISLISPGNLITIFSDAASDRMQTNTFTSFAPTIHPVEFLSKLTGKDAFGNWTLQIKDITPGDTGILYHWGIQINQQQSIMAVTPQHNISLAGAFDLQQNFPNPFNPSTTIRYSVAATSHVILKVYDVLGNMVCELVNREQNPGSYSAKFNAKGMSSGVYFYQLKTETFSVTKKLILMK